jgi:hypothetical protein
MDGEAQSGYTVSIGQGFAGTIAETMQPLYILPIGMAAKHIVDKFLLDRSIVSRQHN